MPITKMMMLRREREFEQFSEGTYKTLWHSPERLKEDTVQVKTSDGTTWTIVRDLNFLTTPPVVMKNGVKMHECAKEWSMAFSSAAWLLMIMSEEGII